MHDWVHQTTLLLLARRNCADVTLTGSSDDVPLPTVQFEYSNELFELEVECVTIGRAQLMYGTLLNPHHLHGFPAILGADSAGDERHIWHFGYLDLGSLSGTDRKEIQDSITASYMFGLFGQHRLV